MIHCLIGPYLTASVFIQDGMRDTLDAEGKIIHFAKRQKVAEIISEIQRYQSITYNFLPVDSIRFFIDKSLDVSATPDDFWATSLEREPRSGVLENTSERRLLMSSFVAF